MENLKKAAALAQKGAHFLVTTASPKGYPHAAPAARINLIPERQWVEVDAWFCPGTLQNLNENKRVDLVIWDPKLDVGYQLLGQNEAIEDLAMMNGFDSSAAGRPQLPQVERRLKIRVEKVLPFQRGAHTDEEET